MRAVLIFCVTIAAAVACPLLDKIDCTCSLPKICPPTWKIKKFDSQYATLAFQGTWILQLASPTYIDEQNPLKTGLFCNTYPSTNNQLTFKDTTPCDDTDYNTEYEMTDSSYNIYTQATDIHKALLSPAYGKCSPYAIFNVGCEKYYSTPLIEKFPFIDKDLYRHKIGQRFCDREYTIAAIGADDNWAEYMVLAVLNQYDNFFNGNDYILWVLTRDLNPSWSTYKKAYEDIEKSGLSPNYLVSVDHSLGSMPGLPMTAPTVPTTPDDINGVVKQTSTSTAKSIVTDSIGSPLKSVTKSTTTTTSTVIIQKNTDFSSLYELGPCDLYKPYDGLQVLKNLDKETMRRALSGNYYMTQATPCSFYKGPKSKAGLLNTCFPSCSMQLCFDDSLIDNWDFITPRMVMDRGYDMRTGELQMTRSYISSVYSDDNPFSYSTFAIDSEGYYPEPIDEVDLLSFDGMICKPRTDIYKYRIIASILAYKENEYLIIGVANRYKNPFFTKKPVPLVYCYTRDRIPSPKTLNSIAQEILRSGLNPNYLMKIDQTKTFDSAYTFDKAFYESTVTTPTKSLVTPRGLGTTSPAGELPSICPKNWNVKTFDNQYATVAFQGTWNLQLASPTYIKGSNPLKTGLFCNTYPSTNNQLTFKDTTPCDDTDYNTEYEMTDSSYNLYTQTTDIHKALLSPAYGKCSPYAFFNVGCEKYYTTPIIEKYPFIDKDLYRHKIGQRYCEREYTIAAIGADDNWAEYMVLAVLNQYDNFFNGNDYILWVLTRDIKPKWSTYKKAYEDIEKSGLSPNYLVSVDHSLGSMPELPMTAPTVPTTPDDINGVVKQTSTSTTKSIVTDNSGTPLKSVTKSTTTTTSTVIIEKNSEYTSLYELGQSDLFNGIQILKSLDKKMMSRALSGKYYMAEATPCSFYNSPNSRVGILNTCFPACSMQICFDDSTVDDWDFITPRMVMDRGYNMKTGELQMTRSYISSVYSDDNPFSYSTFAIDSEGYYPELIVEDDCLPLDGMICKPRTDIYKHRIIASILAYKENEYLIIGIANRYKNPFFTSEKINPVICYTRQRIPSQETLKSMAQELLRCGYNPNHLIKIDQTEDIDGDYVFDYSYYESQTSCWTSGSTIVSSSSTMTISC